MNSRCTFTETGRDMCSQEPEAREVDLGDSCIESETGEHVVDVGSCTSEKCSIQGEKASDDMCCEPTDVASVDILCNQTSYKLQKVLGCGCASCSSGEDVSVFVEVDFPGSNSSEETFLFWNSGSNMSYDAIGPSFDFIWVPTGQDLVIVVEPNNSSYLTTVSTINVEEGVTSIDHQMIIVVNEATNSNHTKVKTIDPADDNDFETFGTVGLKLPANAVKSPNDEESLGDVSVSVVVISPEDQESFINTPGEFTFTDEDGEKRSLETYGAMGVYAFNEEGRLNIDQELQISVNATELGMGDGSALWAFNSQSGNWDFGSLFTNDEAFGSTRRKRQIDPSFRGGKIKVPPYVPYLNFDKPILRENLCSIAVQVKRGSLSGTASGVQVTAYQYNKGNGRYQGYVKSYTDNKGRACLTVQCNKHQQIYVGGRHSSDDLKKPVYQNDLPKYVYEHEYEVHKHFLEIRTPKKNFAFDGRGPIHKYGSWTCYRHQDDNYYFLFTYHQDIGQLFPVSLDPFHSHGWYHYPADDWRRTACMICIEVQVSCIRSERWC